MVVAGGTVIVSMLGLFAMGVPYMRGAALVTILGVLLALTAPFLGVRFGFPDAGNNRDGTTTRPAYDLTADGFGPGANGPLVIAG